MTKATGFAREKLRVVPMKRALAVFFAALTLFSLLTVTTASAASAVSEQTAQQTVSALGIMVGDQYGNMNLDSPVTRAQLAKILVKLSSGNITLVSAVSPFPDVPYTNWAAPYVSRAVTAGYVNGYPDGTYRPDATAKTEEVAKTLLSVLGYSSADYGIGYPWAQMSYAQKLGLLTGTGAQTGAPVTRRDVMLMVYNTLTATAKTGKAYVTTLGYSLTSAGTVDISSLVQQNSVGPITVKDLSWYQSTGLNAATASVYLNDQPASLTSVNLDNIVYYSTDMNTVWAYSQQVTGSLDNVLSSRLSPTSVVVSGTTYTLGSSTAVEAVGYSSGLKYGDTVTLLFGRGGTVADVIPAGTSAAVTGFVTGAGVGKYTDADGNTYTSNYIKLMTTDGSTVQYRVASDMSSYVGSAVSLSFQGSTPLLTALSSGSLSGTVSASSMTVGASPLAADIQILDTDGYGNAVTVFPQRLDGVAITAGEVLYSHTDSNGAVNRLILKGVTGDTSAYGILTNTSVVNSSMSVSGTYAYNIGGTPGAYTAATLFNVTVGPACFTLKNGALTALTALNSLPTVTLSGANAVADTSGTRHLLSDKVSVFQHNGDGTYSLSSLSAVAGKTLTAYYDKDQSSGGLVRILVVQ